jgi:hypothetical protein
MRGCNFGRRIALSDCVLAFAAISLPASSHAARVLQAKPPTATSGGALHGRVSVAKSQKLEFVTPRRVSDVFGSPVIFSGSLSGTGEANHRIAMQASPYPFLEAFTDIGTPGVTDGLGRFSFRISNLTVNTQLRVATLDALPVYSPVAILDVAARVSFSANSSGRAGLVRLYGTVTPAVSGAKVYFQLLERVGRGKRGASTRYVSQFVAPVKPASPTFSGFSTVVKVRRGGRYRAFVKVLPGPLVAGSSARTIVLHGATGGGER